MRKIAIVSFFHPESSLCLAKYVGQKGIKVDYYYIVKYQQDDGKYSGFEYTNNTKYLGIHRLTFAEAPEIIAYFKDTNVNVHLLRIWDFINHPWLNKIILKFSLRIIKNKKYDAINVVGQVGYVSYIHNELKDYKNLIHTIHEIGAHDGHDRLPLIESIIKDNSKIIVHSHHLYQRLISEYKVDKSRVSVIHFGRFETCALYEHPTELSRGIDNSKIVFLLYGFLADYKGLDVLAKALPFLSDIEDKFTIVIAGSGDNKSLDTLQSYRNVVVYNHFLSNAEMMCFIKNSSVILLPYKSASQTGIISTCSLYGKPVIATKVGAFPEMVKDGGNGILIDPNDEQALAAAIRGIVLNKELIDKLGEEMSNWGKDDSYSWLSIADKTIALYKR